MKLTDFKPLPKDLRGWQSDNPIFAELIDKVKPKTIIEVGCWKGRATVNMAKLCKARGLDTKMHCVDTWLGAVEFYTMLTPDRDLMKKHGYPQVYYQFISNLVHEGVEDMVEPLPLPSDLAWRLLPKADLIYIDASHEYEDVKRDIEHYRALLNPGGVIFGDDYGNPDFPGVKQAVDELGTARIVDNWFWIYD